MKKSIEKIYTKLISIDKLINFIFGGKLNETISARCYRCRKTHIFKVLMPLVNFIMRDNNHCKNCYLNK